MAEAGSNKRPRVDLSDPLESAEAKRLREDLFDILDDDISSTVAGDGDGLASVIKSLEDEIETRRPSDPRSDLGFLLEASDDELGLPPTSPLPSSSCSPSSPSSDALFYDPMWGFDDDIPCYDALDFGALADDGSGDYAASSVVFRGLFDEISDFSWRPESLQAL